MRVAALYDVHGNLPALEAVLADPRCASADAIVCGGDLVAGPLPAECLDRLEADGRVRFLSGNCDRETVSAATGEEPLAEEFARWSAARLGEARLARIARWPGTVELDVPGIGLALFCHATPRSDTRIVTRVTPEDDVARELAGVGAELVVCGHVHVQYDRQVGAVRVVNAGSVGMPYEASPDARWLLLGDGGVELASTSYDADGAITLLAATGFPAHEQWFARTLRGEVTAEEVTSYFESQRGA
jgi:predicted phosphodiesterase